jgi:hypothetical protein
MSRLTSLASVAVSLAVALLFAPSLARADDPPPSTSTEPLPPIRQGVNYLGAVVNVFWNNNTTDAPDGRRTGSTETTTGGDIVLGHMLTDRWALQTHLGFNRDFQTTYQQDVANNNISLDTTNYQAYASVGLGYFIHATDATYFFLGIQPQVSYTSVQSQAYDATKNAIGNVDYNGWGLNLAFAPGVVSFLSDHLAAEVALAVASAGIVRASNDQGLSIHQDTLQFLFYKSSLNLGLVYFFDKAS